MVKPSYAGTWIPSRYHSISESNSISPLSVSTKVQTASKSSVVDGALGPINAEFTEGALLDESIITKLLRISEPASVPSFGMTENCHWSPERVMRLETEVASSSSETRTPSKYQTIELPDSGSWSGSLYWYVAVNASVSSGLEGDSCALCA